MNSKKVLFYFALPLMLFSITGCKSDGDVLFKYQKASFKDTIGNRTNEEVHDYNDLKVNKLEKDLRKDFAFGVDASMVKSVEDNGGVYYNEKGQEQEVFQILRRNGVNFVRFRLWNNPKSQTGKPYGGGNNDFETDLALAKRAKAANLNVMIDFHYSDFWADPASQQCPREWKSLYQYEIVQQIESFTKDTLNKFKEEGVTVDAVQIGNEINTGMAGYKIDWNNLSTSYDEMSKMLKAGIKGAKEVFKDVRTVIHLANGHKEEEFETFFLAMDERKVDYDIIGASFYPQYSGSIDLLQSNLDNITEKTGKPAMVVETSWGFTTDYVVKRNGDYVTLHANESMKPGDVLVTENSYSASDERVGNYVTGEQSQATMLRDMCNVLAKVPNKKGLGLFYWEAAWLPVSNAGWGTADGQSYQAVGDDSQASMYSDGLASWSNQALFSYTGKALSSLKTFSYLKKGFNQAEEKSLSALDKDINVVLITSIHETLPEKGKVITDFGAMRDRQIVWSNDAIEAVKQKGTHTGLKGVLDGKFEITATAKCI